ncbi:hypothetical protein [Flavobacterium sp. JAS]|uniref:hypothetical protein n=1 Tax=Flavobacterium sp. JAS TaxID=2897329 RepID=UPI001E3969A9|nr:hypothetical protein [Flavobacterium sp. JAS]MCD0471431.1 hypothetical protein [Flavobacterium sp. JAS]
MKTLFTLGACALLSLTIFSCTADEVESNTKDKITNEVKKDSISPSYATGPDDDPIPVNPPPKK